MRSIQTIDLSHLDHYFLTYFPKILIEKFSDDLLKHPLKNQILTTVLANEVINRMGPCFLLEVCQIESVSILECVQVYFQVIEMFGFEEIWNEIESLDSENVTKDQYKIFLEVQNIVRRLTHSLLGHKSFVHNLEKRQQIHHQILKMLLILYKTKLEIKEHPFVSDYNLSRKFDVLKFFPVILELVCQSYSNHTEKRDHLPQITETFFRVRDELSFSLFYDLEAIITADQGWQLITKTKLYNDLVQAEADLAWHVYKEGGYESWSEKYAAAFAQHRKVIGLVQVAMSAPVKPDLGLLIYVIRHIQNLATVSSRSVFCENDFSFQTSIESLEGRKPSLN
jgi:glutamate dehydrogenase